MTRDVTSNWLTQAQADTCSPVFLFEGVFEGLTLRLWSGVGDITWDSKTWNGNGWLRGFDDGTETDEIAENDCSVKLAGLPAQMVATILGNAQHNATGKIWISFLSSGALVDPYLWFEGLLDEPNLEEGADEAVITVKYTTVLSLNARTREFRYDPETQKLFYPDDQGLDYMTATLEWDGFWGKTKRAVRRQKARKEKNRRDN